MSAAPVPIRAELGKAKPAEAAPDAGQPAADQPSAKAKPPQETREIAAEAAAKPKRMRRQAMRLTLMLLGPVAAVAIGLYLYLGGGRFVESDNAYVQANKVAVAPLIAGNVTAIKVRDNQHVAEGDVLFELDAEPYRIALDAAKAQLGATREQLLSLSETYRQKEADIRQAEIDMAFYEREMKRIQDLQSVASKAQLDAAQHNYEIAKAKLASLKLQASVTLAQLGGDADAPVETRPTYLQALAQVNKAERDLRLTTVRAPFAGVVAKVDAISVGTALAVGAPAFSLIADKGAWVEANLKETDLTYLKVGDTVSLSVDAFPSLKFAGKVETISPATGAIFAVLPAQNATGNWVKIVQRVPVRIRLDDSRDLDRLRAGMSVVVDIDTRHTRSLADLWHGVTGLFGG